MHIEPCRITFVEHELVQVVKAVEFLVIRGKRFMVDFGYGNAIEKANELAHEISHAPAPLANDKIQ